MGNGDIICVALDLDNGRLHVAKNDGLGQTAVTMIGVVLHLVCTVGDIDVSGKLYIQDLFSLSPKNATCEHNFGNGYFGTTAVSSAGTNDGSNIGIFEYDVST